MKLLVKMVLSFVSVVIVFGAVMILVNYQSIQREKDNTIKMYEERGVAVAAAVDSGVTSEQQLSRYAQTIVNKATADNDIGIVEFSIHGKAPDGATATGYWRIASSDDDLIQTPSDPEDIDAITQNKYNVIYGEEDGIKIIDITYPLHDITGVPIATAGIKLDMSSVDKLMIPSTTYIYIILMIVVALLVATFLSFSITRPVKQLTDIANKVSTGSLDAKMPDIKSKDEIGDLSRSLGRMVASIKFMMTDKEG